MLPSTRRAREGFARVVPHWLYVRDVGVGPPIIVVHGGPDFDHEYLLPEMDRLGDAFRVVYNDQRGRGRSVSEQEPLDVTMAREVDDLDLVRESFGCQSVAVLGHSWGGLLALEYALTHPDRVSHPILMNCAPASHDDAAVLRDELARRRSPAQSARMNELRCAAGECSLAATRALRSGLTSIDQAVGARSRGRRRVRRRRRRCS